MTVAPKARVSEVAPVAHWPEASLAARLFAVRPVGLVLRVRAGAGPARDRFIVPLLRLLDDGRVLRCPGRPSIEALEGGVDLAATLATGRTVRSDGLIARASGGVLLVLSAERVGAAEAASLARAVDAGRLGLVLLDEGEEDEAPPPALLERVTLAVMPEVAAPPVAAPLAAALHPTNRRGARRGDRPAVSTPIRRALCDAALSLGIASLRPVLGAERIATHAAILAGRDAVADEDAALAAAMVLAPRATRRAAAAAPPPEATPDPPTPDQPAPNEPAPNQAPGDAPSGGEETGDQAPPYEPAAGKGADRESGGGQAAERVLAAALAVLPPGLLEALAPPPARRDAEARTGRPLPPRRGRLRAGARIAILPTIRAAAPLQLSRRQAAANEGQTRRLVLLPSDVHLARARRIRRRNAIFVVDASGSAAAARLAEAKGAIENLLAECYVRRDRVALLSVRGDGAVLVLPPTAALARARRLLAGMACGGGTPLAAGLDAALSLALSLRRAGEDASVVLMTDGHANVARDGTADRRRAHAEAAASGTRFRESGIPSLLVDIARRRGPDAERLAGAMGARYLPLPGGDTARVGGAVRALAS